MIEISDSEDEAVVKVLPAPKKKVVAASKAKATTKKTTTTTKKASVNTSTSKF